jgi:hypothetical protein
VNRDVMRRAGALQPKSGRRDEKTNRHYAAAERGIEFTGD